MVLRVVCDGFLGIFGRGAIFFPKQDGHYETMLAPDWSKTLCVIHLVFNMSAPMICRFHQGDQEIRTEVPIQNYPDLLPVADRCWPRWTRLLPK